MTLEEYAKAHPYTESEPGDCNNCHWFFSEWDDFERKQIDWCDYHSNVTGKMNKITKDYDCPLSL